MSAPLDFVGSFGSWNNHELVFQSDHDPKLSPYTQYRDSQLLSISPNVSPGTSPTLASSFGSTLSSPLLPWDCSGLTQIDLDDVSQGLVFDKISLEESALDELFRIAGDNAENLNPVEVPKILVQEPMEDYAYPKIMSQKYSKSQFYSAVTRPLSPFDHRSPIDTAVHSSPSIPKTTPDLELFNFFSSPSSTTSIGSGVPSSIYDTNSHNVNINFLETGSPCYPFDINVGTQATSNLSKDVALNEYIDAPLIISNHVYTNSPNTIPISSYSFGTCQPIPITNTVFDLFSNGKNPKGSLQDFHASATKTNLFTPLSNIATHNELSCDSSRLTFNAILPASTSAVTLNANLASLSKNSRNQSNYIKKQNFETIKKHTGNKEYYCPLVAENKCNHVKPFKRRQNLEVHMFVHNKDRERKYVCDGCGRKYFRNNELKRHLLLKNCVRGFDENE